MPNQYTKKKEAAAKAEAKSKMNAGENRPEIHVHHVDMGQLFGNRFPKMRECDEKAISGLPHFTLLATDNFTPVLIREWIELAYRYGTPEAKILEAKALLKRIEEWRAANPLRCKTPD